MIKIILGFFIISVSCVFNASNSLSNTWTDDPDVASLSWQDFGDQGVFLTSRTIGSPYYSMINFRCKGIVYIHQGNLPDFKKMNIQLNFYTLEGGKVSFNLISLNSETYSDGSVSNTFAVTPLLIADRKFKWLLSSIRGSDAFSISIEHDFGETQRVVFLPRGDKSAFFRFEKECNI